MERKAAEAETETAEIGLLASGANGPSQQVNTPTITTTTTDVCGLTSDPVKGGEKELDIQNDWEFNLVDEEALKIKGTPPAINWSASSKDSLQDQTDQNDTYTSNYDETSGHEGDEPKKADLVMENNRVPALHKRTISQLQSKDKRRRSHEHKEKELGIQNDGEFNLEEEEALKSEGTPPAINLFAGSKDSLQDQTDQNYTYISNYDETSGHKRDELNEADLEMENKRQIARHSLHEKMAVVSNEEKELDIQNDWEFNLVDEEALKSKGTAPAINLFAGSKDSLQDQTDQNDTYISNSDETSGHKRDELKEADLEMENKMLVVEPRRSVRRMKSAVSDEDKIDARLRSREPNPGIKRGTVSVLQPPPPPTL